MGAQYCFSCMNELAGAAAICPYCHASQPYHMQDPNDLPAGMVLKKRYLIGRSLGRGGFGATYIARDLKSNKVLTIKEYFPDFACVRTPGSNNVAFKNGKEDKFHSYQAEFKAEAQHLKMLRGIPGVVQYFDYFDALGTSYLVMEYLNGQTLKDLLLAQHRPFSLQEGVDYVLRTLQVLARVHAKGILHRDISPDNIFLTSNGQLYLIDFGSSSLSSQATMTGFTKGVYTAPEQRINGAQGPATDLYAMGVTLFTLLTNHKPKEAEGVQLEEMPSTVPQPVQDVYLKATQHDMHQRYHSADEMTMALSQASGVPMPPSPSNRKQKLKKLLAAMVALVAVLMVVMVLAFSGGSGDSPAEPDASSTPIATTASPAAPSAPTPTNVPVLPDNAWLCRMNGQLYCVSSQGMESLSSDTYPVEEAQLQMVEIQQIESYKLIYGLDAFEVVHSATGQSLPLTDAGDALTLWLLPGEYALRVTRGEHMLAEGFTVPANGPVSLSAASEATMDEWWEAMQAEAETPDASAPTSANTATAVPLPVETSHTHQWQEKTVKAATCTSEGATAQVCLLCGEQGQEVTALPARGHDMMGATCTQAAACTRCGAQDSHYPALGHDWRSATCTTPKTCNRCSVTEGNALGHNYSNESCVTPATCTRCGSTTGSAKGHNWQAATCATPKTCAVCSATEGSAKGHNWQAATCSAPKTCTVCSTTEGSAKGHNWQAATCTTPKTCTVCSTTEGSAKGHNWQDATCTTPKTCTVCSATEGAAKGHNWQDATCTTPKTCTVCSATEGAAKGHNWQAATCTTPKTCTVCSATEDSAKGHTWQDATCTAPKTCTVCSATEGAAKGHTWGNWSADTATCTTNGQVERTCSECDQTQIQNTSVLGHAFGPWNAAQEATCMTPQVNMHYCARCGHQEWEYDHNAPLKDHSYANGVCIWCGMPALEDGLSPLSTGIGG